MWATAVAQFPQLVVVRGRVRLYPDTVKDRMSCELWAASAFFHVTWFLDRMPPDIADGAVITVFGNVCTANLGTRIAIRNALWLPKGGQAVKRQIMQMLAAEALKPSAFVDEEELEAKLKKVKEKQLTKK